MSRLPALVAAAAALLALTCAACGGGGSDAALGRFLQLDARPGNPSARVQFGRGRLPSDFPGGIPMLPRATLAGWQRVTTDSSRSWEAAYEAPGETGAAVSTLTDGLKSAGWQITDSNARAGFQSLNITGSGTHSGFTGVISVGPAVSQGRVQVIAEVGADR